MSAEKVILLVRPPQIGISPRDHQQISNSIKQTLVMLSRTEQTSVGGKYRIDQGKLPRPPTLDIFMHGFGLIRADK